MTAERDPARTWRVVRRSQRCRGVSDASVLEEWMTNNSNNTNETIVNVPLTSIAVDLA